MYSTDNIKLANLPEKKIKSGEFVNTSNTLIPMAGAKWFKGLLVAKLLTKFLSLLVFVPSFKHFNIEFLE